MKRIVKRRKRERERWREGGIDTVGWREKGKSQKWGQRRRTGMIERERGG